MVDVGLGNADFEWPDNIKGTKITRSSCFSVENYTRMYLNDTWLTSKSKMKANRKMGLNLRTVEVNCHIESRNTRI